MKKLITTFSILLTSVLYQNIAAQCDFDSCPSTIMVDVLTDQCDETNGEILNITGFDYDDAGTGPFLTESDFLDVEPMDAALNSDCDGTEMYGYIDGPIQNSFDCVADGYFSLFERTWEVYDAGGTLLSTCVQEIQLVDLSPPMAAIDLVAFFEDQDPNGDSWNSLMGECPLAGNWVEPVLGTDVTDNCSPGNGIEMTSNISPFDQLADGLNVIEYTFTDGCGNVMDIIEWDIVNNCVEPCMGAPIISDCNESLDPNNVTCDINDINGFMSCTPAPLGGTFGELCDSNGAIHNPSYFSFVAGSEDIEVTVGISDCLMGDGVQANIADPCDASTCYGDSGSSCIPGGQLTFNATGLTIGNVYQLVVDGCNGDQCAYEVTIDQAQAFEIFPPEDEIALVEDSPNCEIDINNIVVCPGTIVTFFPENYEEAEFFFCWDVDNPNGVNIQNSDTDCQNVTGGGSFACSSTFTTCGALELEFVELGNYEICLSEMDNGCDNFVPGNYCFEVNVVAVMDLDWGTLDVCEEQLPFFNPPPHPVTGEQWQGASGGSMVIGMNTFDVEDDCDCNYTQILDLNVLPLEDDQNFEFEVCAAELTNWVDPNYGIGYADILPFQIVNTNFFEAVIVENASMQVDWAGENCDVVANYTLNVYDIPGMIVQTSGSACDATLSFEINQTLFPDFMTESGIQYNWTDSGGGVISIDPSVNVDEAGSYDLTLTYATTTGEDCVFNFSTTVDLSGSTPGMPTFISAPTATCEGMLSGLVYSVTPSAGSTYTWTATNGTITSGQGTDAIMVDVVDSSLPMTISVFASTPGCGDSPTADVTLNVTPSPVVEFNMVMDACVGETIMIGTTLTAGSAETYNWTVGPDATVPNITTNLATLPVSWSTPGTKTFSLSVVDAGGCESVEISGTIEVLAALTPPVATCTVENSNTVTIEWTDVIDGQTTVMSSIPGTQNGTTYTVDGLASGTMVTFTLITQGGTHPCGDSPASTVTCETSNCTLMPVISSPENDICLNGMTPAFQLASTPNGGAWSGTGVDPSGMFDPTNALPGDNVITYEVYDPVLDCDATATLTIVAFENPDPTFTLSATNACIGEPITINYTDIPGYTTNWNYGAGASMPMNITTGQFEISYATSGQKIINLEVSNGTCMVEFELPLEIYPALPEPIVTCAPTPNSVNFSWDDVMGVSMYEVEVLSGGMTTTTMQTETSIPVGGLTSGDEVIITVTAIDPNGCENSVTVLPCIAQDCPVYTVAIDPGMGGAAQCWDPVAGVTIPLSASVVDDMGNPVTGMGNWSGPTGLDPMTGVFSPNGPSPTPYTVAYNFVDGNGCPAVGTIDVNIFDSPSSSFGTDVNELCIGDELTIILDDAYSSAINYDVQLSADSGDFTLNDNGDGTFTIIFTNDPGADVDISLETTAGSCMSGLSEATVTVLAPLEFSIMDQQICYKIDDGAIGLEALDMDGDLVMGSWEVVDGGPIPGTDFSPSSNDTTYTLIFTEANCGVQEMMTLELVAEPTLSIGPLTQTICISEEANLSIDTDFYDELTHTGLNGTSDMPPLSGLEPNFTLSFQDPGVYTYESVIDRPGTCDSDVIEWEIIVEEEPSLPALNCAQTLSSVSFDWDADPCAEDYTIIYNGPDGEVIVGTVTDNSITIDDLDQGDEIEIFITINSSCACEFPDVLTEVCSAEACEPATITIGDELDTEYCVSDLPGNFSMSADVSGIDIENTGSFSWSGEGIDSDGNVELSGLTAGDYTFNVEYNEDGCVYNESIDFTILEAPQAIIDVENAPCPESTAGSINIVGLGNGPFVYSTENSTLAEGENDLDIGSYVINIVDANGCSSDVSVTVGQNPTPTADFVVPETVFAEFDQTFTFDLSTQADSVVWIVDGQTVLSANCIVDDCSTLVYEPLEFRPYEVCIEAYYGECLYTECREMIAEEFIVNSIYIPNIFDPTADNDPINSNLDMYIAGYSLTVKDVSIYDRWGNRVHYDDTEKMGSNKDVITLWDGTFNGGTEFVPGVYVYVVELLFDDGITEFRTGSITVVE